MEGSSGNRLDHENQCGFRPGRSTTDAIFNMKSALKKRSEHGLESWVLFIDLVKAFDKVPPRSTLDSTAQVWSP